MKRGLIWMMGWVVGWVGMSGRAALGSNLRLTGLEVMQKTASNVLVRFDVAWDNSWRCDIAGVGQGVPYNWDATWLFIKYRRIPLGVWAHATLSESGHEVPVGAKIDVPLDGKGAFLYRAENGKGTFTVEGVGLRWNFAADGVSPTSHVDLKVVGIEMVYVPTGSFAIGSGAADENTFYDGGAAHNPYWITSEDAIEVGASIGKLYYTSNTMYGGDRLGPIPAAYPKGYGAFYGMKTEISQGQYCEFLNTLTAAQATNRYKGSATSTSRYEIVLSGGIYTSANWYVACNFMSWADVAAYADWAALRPMTELEFEKAGRGPLTPVPLEYAWGSTNIWQAIGISNRGSVVEVPSNVLANCVYGYAAGVRGPMRVGCLARGGTSRQGAGAGYYGMLDLCGNVWERCVTVGNAEGRAFSGLHGDGVLNAVGNADVVNWPGTNAVGVGYRGNCFVEASMYVRLSNRRVAAVANPNRQQEYGGRCVRTAP